MRKILATILTYSLFVSLNSAAIVVNFLNTSTTPKVTPSGNHPWEYVVFRDIGEDKVLMNISADLEKSEFISDLSINLNPELDPHDLTFTLYDSRGDFEVPTISYGKKFDIGFSFETRGNDGGKNRFNETDSLTYIITSKGVNANSFTFLDDSNKYYVLSHVQNIGSDATSCWITTSPRIPETSSAIIGGIGIIILLARRRR